MKSILVTGGAGFIGSNFIRFMLEYHTDYKIVNVDNLTYAGNIENLRSVEDRPNYFFIKADIRDRIKIDKIFNKMKIDTVVNFAAESHVDRSIEEPEIFLKTNVIGTQVLMDVALKNWRINPRDKHCRTYVDNVKFIQISTDEVYGSLGAAGKFTEETPIAPNSPYSASKAGADMLARAYHKTYGFPINITRCSNNYGPYQFPEKLIPLMICNCIKERCLPIYGDGMQIRDWIHVMDHCNAIDTVLHMGKDGEVYNIGGNAEKTNIEIVEIIIEILGKSKKLIKHVKDRPGHDRRYAIDNSKITKELGWSPAYTFEQGVNETIRWYQENKKWVENILSGEYSRYYDRMYKNV